MANPSKRYPWVVQMFIPSIKKWVDMSAYRSRLEADNGAQGARNSTGYSVWIRVIDFASKSDCTNPLEQA